MGTFQINVKTPIQGRSTCCNFAGSCTQRSRQNPSKETRLTPRFRIMMDFIFPDRAASTGTTCLQFSIMIFSWVGFGWLPKGASCFPPTSFSKKCSFKASRSRHAKHKYELIQPGTMPLNCSSVGSWVFCWNSVFKSNRFLLVFISHKRTIKLFFWNNILWMLNFSHYSIHLSSSLSQKCRFYSPKWNLEPSLPATSKSHVSDSHSNVAS